MKVILIDGMHLSYRCHHVHLNLFSSEAEPTGVLHGFLSSILSLQSKYPESSMVFCWDKGQSWRKKIAPVYKASRSTTEDRRRVYGQVDILQGMLDSIGFKQVMVESVEGDDSIGILARLLSAKDDIEEVLVYSGDHDFYQLIGGKVKVVKASGISMEVIDEQSIINAYMIKPDRWTRMRAISGDKSDEMKALKGIGPKTAVLLLSAGLDPAIATVPDELSKKLVKYAELFRRWDKVNLFYRMSELPRKVEDLTDIPDDLRKKLHVQIDAVVFHPGRISKPGMGVTFREALGKYELEYIFSKRRQFWSIP